MPNAWRPTANESRDRKQHPLTDTATGLMATRLPPSITPHHPAIILTALTQPLTDPPPLDSAAIDFRLPPPAARGRRPGALIISLLMHAGLFALLIFAYRHHHDMTMSSAPGIAVVFQGGEAKTQAPKATRHGQPELAQNPVPATPPAPPEASAPQVRLQSPEPETEPLPAPLQPPPPPTKQAIAKAVKVPPHKTAPYMRMDHFSYNSARPAPPLNPGHPGMNLQLSQSDLDQNGPEITFHGHVGADWEREFTDWVNAHKYYPQAAADQGQSGSVEVHLVVTRDGHVKVLQLESSSGKPLLDMAWFGLFRDADLPPFPPNTKAQDVTIDARMHFILIR